MFCSPYLMVLLLTTTVQMASAEPLDVCDVVKKPSTENLDIQRFLGRWYLKAVSTNYRDPEDITFRTWDVTTYNSEGTELLYILTNTSFSSIENECFQIGSVCHLEGSLCADLNFHYVFEIIAIEYDSVMASWSEYTLSNGETYFALELYTRDAFSQPDMSSIQSALQEFCGAPAADPTSSFYNIQPSYSDSPCLG